MALSFKINPRLMKCQSCLNQMPAHVVASSEAVGPNNSLALLTRAAVENTTLPSYATSLPI